MFDPVVVVSERAAGVVGRVNENALNFASEFLFKSLECQQIITKNKFVVEKVVLCHAMLRVT